MENKGYERTPRVELDQVTCMHCRNMDTGEEHDVPVETADISESGLRFFCCKELGFMWDYRCPITLWSGREYKVIMRIKRVRREMGEGWGSASARPMVGYAEYGADFVDEMEGLRELRKEIREYIAEHGTD